MEVPKISEYSLLGDCRTGALIGPTGTLAWYCAPRFDSSASFAALLGDHENGAWTLAPNDPTATATSSYVEGTLVLETTFEVVTGSVRVTDFLAIDSPTPTLVRSVECTRGIVAMRSGFAPKMKFGKTTPWTRRRGDAWLVEVAPDGFALRADVELGPTKDGLVATFDARAGERVTFAAQWFEAPGDAPAPIDAAAALAATRDWWTSWAANFRYSGADSAVVLRSALTLKALQHRDSGAFVAAPTTSLPEEIGGTKNWDYRYTWLRDASFTVQSLVSLGFTHEAGRWRDFFASLCAGQPETLHIMYACDGTELAGERTAEKLSGFADSEPVHIANAANTQFQLGVYGDVVRSLDAMNQAGVEIGAEVWRTIEPLAAFVEKKWRMPGNGIWETRNGGRQYVDSKVMAWVALDRLLAIAKRTSLRFDSREIRGGSRCHARRDLPARLRPAAKGLHAILRLLRTRREPALDAARRLPAGRRRTVRRDRRGDREGAGSRRLRVPVLGGFRAVGRRKYVARRGRVHHVWLLARARVRAPGAS